MARLVLMRHAKAEPGLPGQADVDRGLAERGHRDGAQAAAVIAGVAMPEPVVVLVSVAERTQATYGLIRHALPGHDLRIEPSLYEAGVSTVVSLASGAQAGTCVVIGHNPTMRDTAAHLTDAHLPSFPTSGIAVLDGDWSAMGSGEWRLASFEVPRDQR